MSLYVHDCGGHDTNMVNIDDPDYENEMLGGGNTESVSMLQNALDTLSQEAKLVIGLIYKSPQEFLDVIGDECNGHITKNGITIYLRRYTKWQEWLIRYVLKEIKYALDGDPRGEEIHNYINKKRKFVRGK